MSFLKKLYSRICRKWTYFRIALIIVPTLFVVGLQNTTAVRKKVTLDNNHNSLSVKEKALLKQKYTSCDNSEKSTRIIRTGGGTILEFQKKVSVSDPNSNEIFSEWDINEVILVKNDGILPGAEGFSPNPKRHPLPRIRGQGQLPPHLEHLANMQGFNYPKYKYKGYAELDTSLNGNRGNQCRAQTKTVNLTQEYENFMWDMEGKGLQVNCDQQRFNSLAQENGQITNNTVFETKGCLQAEAEGLFKDVRRPQNPDVKLDFQAIDSKTGKTIFVDHKGLPPRQDLIQKKVHPSQLDYEAKALNMGGDIVTQKTKHLGFPGGPKSADDVLHLVNFENIKNPCEKEALMRTVLKGAADAGSTNNITFINCN
jgi:hypothetical protein